MGMSRTTESEAPISGDCGGGGGAASTVTNNPARDEAVEASPFQLGESVLAFHGFCMYDAKVQKIESSDGGWRYYVHYHLISICSIVTRVLDELQTKVQDLIVNFLSSSFSGMEQKGGPIHYSINLLAIGILDFYFEWDEWLDVDCLLKPTEENVQKQKELKEKYSVDNNVKPGRLSHDKIKNSPGGRGRKRKVEINIKEEDIVQLEKYVTIQIPPPLKKQLIDDHEYITHLGQVVKLPRSPTVHEILRKYFDYRVKKDDMIVETLEEIVNGLQCYFDKALPAMLLYKQERQQYREVIADNVSPSNVYGAEHLLRLFVKLPEMLSYLNIEKETLTELQQRWVDFLRFLQSNHREFFVSNYHKSDEDSLTDVEEEEN